MLAETKEQTREEGEEGEEVRVEAMEGAKAEAGRSSSWQPGEAAEEELPVWIQDRQWC